MQNWAKNITFSSQNFVEIENIIQLQKIIESSNKLKVVGTGHSFSEIADTTGTLVSLKNLDSEIEIDEISQTVKVAAGTSYANLAKYLEKNGWAVSNLASLGEITIQWNATEYDSFVVSSRLYYSPTGAPGSWSLIYNNIPKTVSSFVHKNLNTRNKDHYYFMTNVDSCGKNTDSTGIHKTIDLSVTPRKVRNRLNFTPYAGFTPCSYFILRQDTGSMRVIDTIAGTDTAYIDFQVLATVGFITELGLRL